MLQVIQDATLYFLIIWTELTQIRKIGSEVTFAHPLPPPARHVAICHFSGTPDPSLGDGVVYEWPPKERANVNYTSIVIASAFGLLFFRTRIET